MTIVRGIVTFDPDAFTTQYPAFVKVTSVVLQNNFNLATLQLNNSWCSVVQDEPTRQMLLYLLTAHITALLNGVNGKAPTGLVGRISGATEGSVSVQTEFKTDSEAEAYYSQSVWGVTFWRSTVSYRTAQYIPPCNEHYGPSWNAWPE